MKRIGVIISSCLIYLIHFLISFFSFNYFIERIPLIILRIVIILLYGALSMITYMSALNSLYGDKP